MTVAPGSRLGPYQITAKLGQGGMGEVFRARDARLNRDVALKLLPASVGADPERLERFRREAQAVAALNHPNIVTLYSIEEADGVQFLTMELVEGRALEELIPAAGLPLDSWLEIGSALADAVVAAHAKGIVHRDLKPANVMIGESGRVKVLDFGLAKMTESGPDGSDPNAPTLLQTREGVVMGTLPYMSPEQVRGQPLDERTDLFSLGVILYEMATGDRPFRGETAAELGSAILRDPPPPLTERRGALPTDVERILRRCLEKEPRDRMPSARALHDELRLLRRDISSSARSATPESGGESSSGRAGERFWVAVLPVKHSGGSGELAALAEGLTEGIATGLSRFSYLHVVSRSSTSRFADQVVDVRSAGRELGARYVMEGSIRQVGTKMRLAVQLVDTTSGAQLWAESYDRAFDPEAVFELQDDLVPRIVSTVADQNGILTRLMSDALRSRSEDSLTPHEASLRAFTYFERVTPEEHAVIRRILERAVREAPDHADCWAMLSLMYAVEFADEFNPGPDPLDRALTAAQRSVQLAATHALGHYAMAFVYFLRKETASFRAEAEKALALNPMDGSVMGILGLLIEYAGEPERGFQLVETAMQLNPNHSGLFRWSGFTKAYGQGRYAEALECAVRINMPNYFYAYAARAAALGQLGQREAAAKELRELLALRPDFATAARRDFAKWYDSELVEQMLEGLRKAGLDIAPEPAAGAPAPVPALSTPPNSGASRVDEGFWVAVLPFKSSGGSADLAALAEGLTEEIVTGLSRFSYLRVISRSSTLRFTGEAADVRSAGKELGARYVMEGSLRQAGSKLRLAVQLVDALSGAHLWAESYERTFSPETAFELQDDLVPRIVSTVADIHGVLPRSMGEAVRNRSPEQLSPYEAVLRSFVYFNRVTADELSAARSALALAVEKAPDFADAWAMLAVLCAQDYGQGFGLLADPLESGAAAARRAVELAPSSHLAHFSLAQVLYFQKERQAFRIAAERAAALNPMDGNSIAFMGELLVYSGDFERGLALAERAKQLNPNHPGWYWYANYYHAYLHGDDAGALEFAHKVNLPKHWGQHVALAAALGQLGESAAAAKAVRNLLEVRPNCAAGARGDFEKWWESEYVERLIAGLRKAGLDVPAPGAR